MNYELKTMNYELKTMNYLLSLQHLFLNITKNKYENTSNYTGYRAFMHDSEC